MSWMSKKTILAAALLCALGGGATWALVLAQREAIDPSQSMARVESQSAIEERAAAAPSVVSQNAAKATAGARVLGAVLQPDGRPAAGVTVTLYRQTSAWPEWRREGIETVTTGTNGAFSFDAAPAPGQLVGFDHPDFAGDVVDAPEALAFHTLRLLQGFDVEGTVANDAGLPMANVRVSLESPLADERPLRIAMTSASGRFRFRNVAAGAMRVVARHDLWQPATLANVVVGEIVRSLELRFARPAIAIDGRVLAAATQEPVADAIVLALPPVQRLGRNQPSTARTGVDGRFRLAGLATGVHRVEVRHPSFGIALRTVTVGPGAAALAFELPQRADVRGRIATDGVTATAGAQLMLRSSADELVVADVKDDGSFEFSTKVTPGPASLSVADGRFAFETGSRILPIRIEETGAPLQLRAMNPAVVEGRVVDETGAAVIGARITSTETGMLLDRLSRAGSALLDRDIGKLGDQLARTAAGEPQPLLAVTGPDGSFRVAGLLKGSASLRIACDGFGSRTVKVEVPMCGDTTSAEPVTLPRGCTVTGRVRRGGRAIAGVQVGVVVEGAAVVAVTGSDGRYALRDLPPGDYRPAARYASFPTVRARVVASVEEGGEATTDIDLPQGRTIRGVVTGTDAQPVEGALVLLRGEQGNPVITDSNGAFELEAPNRDVALVIGQFDRTTRRTVEVPAQRDRVDVRIDVVRTGAVTAHVIGLPNRRPLAGVLLRVTRSGSEGSMPSRWFDLDAGMLRNPLFPAGSSRAVFWAEGYAPVVRDVVVRAGEEVDLGEIAMEPGSELRGVVHDENGAPVGGAEVFLGEEADFFEYQSPLRTAEDGTFVVQGVSSAAANLLVRAAGYAWSSTPLRLPEDALDPEPFEVALERGSTIEARVRGGDAEGSMVVLRRGARVVATAEVGEDGIAVFGNRSPGAYALQRFGDDRTRAVAVVKQSGEVVRVDL